MAQEIGRMVSWGDVNPNIASMMIQQMEEASARKPESCEILCYGLLVKAIKNV